MTRAPFGWTMRDSVVLIVTLAVTYCAAMILVPA